MKWLCLLILFSVIVTAESRRRRWRWWRRRPCTKVDGTWSEWTQVGQCPDCDTRWTRWTSYDKRESAVWKRFCEGAKCGGSCPGDSVETQPCPALNVSVEDNLGEWRVTRNCTGHRYRVVEKNTTTGWWFSRKRVKKFKVHEYLSSVTCNSTGDVHAPKKAFRWLRRECVDDDGCRGCPPWSWKGECLYARHEKCDLPPCEEPTTELPEVTPAREETTAPPEETTAPPEETTAPPEETTAPPEETTAPPEETTAPPEETTAPPEATTAPPEATTAPPETTPAPTDFIIIIDNEEITETSPEEPVRPSEEPALPPEEPVLSPDELVRPPEEPADLPGEIAISKRSVNENMASNAISHILDDIRQRIEQEQQKFDGLRDELKKAKEAAVNLDDEEFEDAEDQVREEVFLKVHELQKDFAELENEQVVDNE